MRVGVWVRVVFGDNGGFLFCNVFLIGGFLLVLFGLIVELDCVLWFEFFIFGILGSIFNFFDDNDVLLIGWIWDKEGFFRIFCVCFVIFWVVCYNMYYNGSYIIKVKYMRKILNMVI